jgi:hypothetical protein
MSFMESAKRALSRGALELKKDSPHIFFVVGIAGVIGGTILACRATLKLDKELEDFKTDISDRKEFEEKIAPHFRDKSRDDYVENNYNKQMAKIYIRHSVRIAKLYAPAGGVMIISIGLLGGSHAQLTRRNAALMSAYAALQTAYENYRNRVREEIGEEREAELYRDVHIKNEKGEIVASNPTQFSPFARFFDEFSTDFTKDPEVNRFFIQCQEEHANDILRSRGHVFLNDAYDYLGLDRTRAGAIVGWVYDPDNPNKRIDFGIFNERNSPFVNGWERAILLDFNVDGIVYDKIKE